MKAKLVVPLKIAATLLLLAVFLFTFWARWKFAIGTLFVTVILLRLIERIEYPRTPQKSS